MTETFTTQVPAPLYRRTRGSFHLKSPQGGYWLASIATLKLTTTVDYGNHILMKDIHTC